MCQRAKFVQFCSDSCIRMKYKLMPLRGGAESLGLWRTKFNESPRIAASSSTNTHDDQSLSLWRAKFNESRISEGYTNIDDRGRLWLAAARRLNRHSAKWNRQGPRN